MLNLNKKKQIIKELTTQLFIVEGVITDLITRETIENINTKSRSTTGAIAVGSALLGQIGTASLASFAASDEGIDVSDFALEVLDDEGVKHYFKGCFPEVIFKVGDQVKVIAQPFKPEYDYVSAIIYVPKQYMWTSQQVERGCLNYRVFVIKLIGSISLFTLIIFFVYDFFRVDFFDQMLFSEPSIQITSLIYLIIFVFIGWRVGASFDEQSIELEAILKKLGFYKPTMISLGDYSVSIINIKNKVKVKDDEFNARWKSYTYRIDLAQKDDFDKYGKK